MPNRALWNVSNTTLSPLPNRITQTADHPNAPASSTSRSSSIEARVEDPRQPDQAAHHVDERVRRHGGEREGHFFEVVAAVDPDPNMAGMAGFAAKRLPGGDYPKLPVPARTVSR